MHVEPQTSGPLHRRKPAPTQQTSPPDPTHKSGRTSGTQSSWLITALYVTILSCFIGALVYLFVLRQVVLTSGQLGKFDGLQRSQLYVAVLGKVFDVSRSKSMYGSGGTYAVFVGNDASRAFATGNFEEATDDLTGLKDAEIQSIFGWLEFYEKAYSCVGVVVGQFYDVAGRPTPRLLELEALRPEHAPAAAQPGKIPGMEPCGMRWPEGQRTVWCKPGMFPRDVGKRTPRGCACFSSTMFAPDRKLYPECHADSTECSFAA